MDAHRVWERISHWWKKSQQGESNLLAPSCGLPRGRTVLNWFGWQYLAQKSITLGIAEGQLQKPTQIPSVFKGHWEEVSSFYGSPILWETGVMKALVKLHISVGS